MYCVGTVRMRQNSKANEPQTYDVPGFLRDTDLA